MARPWRIEFPGACYHVINRGNYRRNLFLGKGAAEAFERTLAEAAGRFGWRVHAYVVMSTHFHLAVELTEPNLSVGMKWLQGTWIRRYNSLHRLVGRPIQGRYKAPLVEPGHALAQVCHYIHLNPVRAGIVPAGRIMEYAWSSLPKLAGRDRPAWLEPAVILGESGELADSAKGWKSYRHYLEFLATDETAKKELVAKRMSRGWCVGSKEFRQEMKLLHARRGADLDRFAGLGPDEINAERRQVWEETLQVLAVAAGVRLASLPARKSHPDKALLAAAMKQRTSVSNGWLAGRLQMGQPASASQFARRFLLDPAGARSVTRLLSRVKT
jgi:REP element-mobilizing transposase RayT